APQHGRGVWIETRRGGRASRRHGSAMKVAIIGGGSAYMPGLAFSFARESAAFEGAELVLHDIDSDALDLQRRLTAGILRANATAPIDVSATTELDRALDGADFVLTTFRPGGLEA